MVAGRCYKATVNESETIKAAQLPGELSGVVFGRGGGMILRHGFPALSPIERS